MKHTISINEHGTLCFIHNDAFIDLIESGDASINRASHVEPTATGQWEADMSPVNGPVLGPFRTRQEALDAEVEWLNRKMFS